MFDMFHDLGDPVAAAQHVLQSHASNGTPLLVEPLAHDSLVLSDCANPGAAPGPVGRLRAAPAPGLHHHHDNVRTARRVVRSPGAPARPFALSNRAGLRQLWLPRRRAPASW